MTDLLEILGMHKWGKWEQYEVTLPARRISKNYVLCEAVQRRQRNQCEKCGKVVDQEIYTTPARDPGR